MRRKPYKIPESWGSWHAEITFVASIGDWDVLFYQPLAEDDPHILMYSGHGAGYNCIRMRDGLEVMCLSETPNEVLTFARSYRALVS